jgi:hypothetical protein
MMDGMDGMMHGMGWGMGLAKEIAELNAWLKAHNK